MASELRLFLCGDVMTGRGIDQIMRHPSDPVLHEPYMRSAAGYVDLAEEVNGAIPKQVDPEYIWGDALVELEKAAPDARIINLETAVTASGDYWRGKGINYRMHPDNITCFTTAKIDCCVLANNHLLDWGYSGLHETLVTLHHAGLKTAGAGHNETEARTPAIVETRHGRILVFAYGAESSGCPREWAAATDKPGITMLETLGRDPIMTIAADIARAKRPDDVAIASIHWGPNWGYEIAHRDIGFAHRLIDEAGIDIVHGHSSHHVKAIEIYHNKPIFYGCGDFLNDYEGIRGYEAFRDDLALMYFPRLDTETGNLLALDMTPLKIRNFRLNRPSERDVRFLQGVLNREGRRFGVEVNIGSAGKLSLSWQ